VGCEGEAGAISGITSNGNGIQYSWNNSVNTANNTNLTAGTYVLTITDANNCISTMTVFVPALTPVVLDETQVTLVNPTCLLNGSITGITASGGTNSYTYTWQPGNINSLNLQNLAAGSYLLLVTDANGCSDTSALYTLTPPNYPIASFTYTPLIPNLGDSVTFTNTSINYTTEQWVNAGITVFQPSPWSYSYTAGTFQVTLTVTNNEGCVDTANAFITVYDQIEVPNVFSPNGDQINEVLYIQSLKPNTSLTILNRWGNVVYFSENYLNNWNGTDENGTELTEGVYTIILTDLQQNEAYYFIHLFR
jgi:gliding motility-associated-like protein